MNNPISKDIIIVQSIKPTFLIDICNILTLCFVYSFMVSYSAIETIVTGESMIDVVERNLGKKFETEDENADDSSTGM